MTYKKEEVRDSVLHSIVGLKSQRRSDLDDGGARRRRHAIGRCASAALVLLVVGLPASGQTAAARSVDTPRVESFPLTSPIRATLGDILENWQLWEAAFLQSDREEASRAVTLLLATASQLGMSRLPDLSLAVLVRALESAEGGDTERAGWALEDAERLDPGRPENRFASAHLRRAEGRYLASVSDLAAGYLKARRDGFLQLAWRENMLLLIPTILLLAGGLFLSLEIVVKGRRVLDDLAGLFGHLLSVPAAYGLAFFVSIWPVFLVSGWRWLFLYWAVLLWRYLSRSESVVVLSVGAVILSSPLLLRSQQERVEIDWSAPLQAVRNIQGGRLSGGLFADLESLVRTLPETAAMHQLAADLHLQIGQTEMARTIYEGLLEEEPRNAAAHNNLGGYYMMRRQFGDAVKHLERSTALDLEIAEPYYNLYQINLEHLGIDEAIRALNQARERAPEEVTRWVEEGRPYVSFSQGSERFAEIREALLVARRAQSNEDSSTSPYRRSGLVSLMVCLVIALVLVGLISYFEGGPVAAEGDEKKGFGMLAAMVPGLPSMQSGNGFKAFAALLPIAAPLVLVRGASLGYRVPWGLVPANTIPWLLLAVSLTVFFILRWWLGSREEKSG